MIIFIYVILGELSSEYDYTDDYVTATTRTQVFTPDWFWNSYWALLRSMLVIYLLACDDEPCIAFLIILSLITLLLLCYIKHWSSQTNMSSFQTQMWTTITFSDADTVMLTLLSIWLAR
jgi:hypothetical protein